MELNKIYQKDCIVGLKELQDNSIDLVLTDPPYNVDLNYDEYKDVRTFEEYVKWCSDWFKELKRVCKGIILITPGTNNENMWYKIEKPRGVIIWNKPNSCSPSKLLGINVYEPIFLYVCSDVMKFKCGIDLITQNISMQKEIGNHPCPKPLKLFRTLINNFSNEGDIVLDCFMGSGTTAVACKQLNRKYVGFEISPQYIEISNKRLSQNNLSDFWSNDTHNKDLTEFSTENSQIEPNGSTSLNPNIKLNSQVLLQARQS